MARKGQRKLVSWEYFPQALNYQEYQSVRCWIRGLVLQKDCIKRQTTVHGAILSSVHLTSISVFENV